MPETNKEIARLLEEIADALEIKGELVYKINAYRKAARVLRDHPEDVRKVWEEGRLQELPGIGERMREKIEEYLKTGKMEAHEEALRGIPATLLEVLQVPDVGPKTVKLAWEQLGVQDLEGFRRVVEDGSLAKLPGMGPKKVEKIRRSLEFHQQASERLPIGKALPIAEYIVEELRGRAPVKQVAIAGSLRRWKETIGDIDILVTTDRAKEVMEVFVRLPEVTRVLAHGETKSSIIFDHRIQVDVRVVPEECFGAALAYFTGSKAHNIRMRELARKKGWKLSEYGLFEGEVRIAGRTEQEIFDALGLPWIPPELREDQGEIEAALEGRLPRLVRREDIRADLHVHTNYSDGSMSIEAVAGLAEEMGYEYLVITDHSQGVKYAHGLEPERLRRQWEEIAEVQRRHRVRLLRGAEVDILGDGSLDYPDEILRELDFVIAAVHQGFTRDNTERILRALRNPYVTALAHPTGRLLGGRAPYPVDLEKVLRFCAENGILVEINSHYQRLDLNDQFARMAKDLGVLLYLGTDHHHPGGMANIRYGLGVARRAWLEPENIANTRPLEDFLAIVRRRRAAISG